MIVERATNYGQARNCCRSWTVTSFRKSCRSCVRKFASASHGPCAGSQEPQALWPCLEPATSSLKKLEERLSRSIEAALKPDEKRRRFSKSSEGRKDPIYIAEERKAWQEGKDVARKLNEAFPATSRWRIQPRT